MTKSYEQVKQELNDLNKKMTWRKIAELPQYRGIPAGTLCSIANGREPTDKERRRMLELPIYAPAVVCPSCGIVHVKSCPHNNCNRKSRGKPWQLIEKERLLKENGNGNERRNSRIERYLDKPH